jgi:F-type H+-transporting ATPase subunit epsilon
MKLFIYKLGGTVFEGEASSVNMPTETGQITVLPHHIPLITALDKGIIKAKINGSIQEFPLTKGFAEIGPQKVILLVE